MINNYSELRMFLAHVFPYDNDMSTIEKQMARRAYNALIRTALRWIEYPITDKKVLNALSNGYELEKHHAMGRKTVGYIITKTHEYLDSLTLSERQSIEEEDKDYENFKNSGAFKVGDVVLYKRAYSEFYELGVVKRPCNDGSGDCFVWYHQGDTASRTPYSCLRKIDNLYAFEIRRIRADEEVTTPVEGTANDD